MHLRIALRGLLVALCASSLLQGCAHEEAAQGPVVKSLKIEGAQQVRESDIKSRIATSQTSWIPFSKKRRFDANVWSTDLQRIERYYHARGFFQAQVLDNEVEPIDEDKVRIVVHVREGEPTIVSRLRISGLEGLPQKQQDEVLSDLGLKEGQVFREDAWAGLKPHLVAALGRLGYAEAMATGEAKVDLATHQAMIDVHVDPGVRYHPGEVHVQLQPGGRIEAWRVQEQVEAAIRSERWWNEEVRHEAQQRVFDLGAFGAASVTAGKGDPQTQLVPIEVSATEAPFHDVGVGFGVGIEQQREEAHATAEYTHRDFLGGLRRLTLRGKAGWAFIPSALGVITGNNVTQSGPIADFEAHLDQPRLWSPFFQLHSELEVQKVIYPAYSYYGGRAKLGISYKPWTWVTIEPSYNFEIYRLTQGQATVQENAPQLLLGCPGTCILSYMEERFALDRRDNPQEPRAGYYLALSFQQGGGPLGGSFNYFRVVPEVRLFRSVLPDKRLTFAGRVKVGTLIPLSGAADLDTPVVARFFSGGDDMRGFSTQRLSPMRVEAKSRPSGDFNGEPEPIGGNGLFEASFETRYHLTQTLVVAAFLDTGFVTTEHVPLRLSYFTDNLLYAVGGGIRYLTPVGPIRVDLAYRLPFGPALQVFNVPGSGLNFQPSQGCFGIGHGVAGRGGAPEGTCAIHLSVGEAF